LWKGGGDGLKFKKKYKYNPINVLVEYIEKGDNYTISMRITRGKNISRIFGEEKEEETELPWECGKRKHKKKQMKK